MPWRFLPVQRSDVSTGIAAESDAATEPEAATEAEAIRSAEDLQAVVRSENAEITPTAGDSPAPLHAGLLTAAAEIATIRC
jgi:hypothetical protein